jgi:BirA family biotin operon repressor/biotin-[acetyl-CoA-carboxylase] ligase
MMQIKKFVMLDSTNQYSKLLLQQSTDCQGTVVVADMQTSGKGQRGRVWISSAGNLFCSIITQPILPKIVGQLAYVTVLAVGEVIEKLSHSIEVTYKWPNDLLVNGAKISGILVENEENGAVVGIGVNITNFPADTALPATCLYQHGIKITRDDLLAAILINWQKFFVLWENQGFIPIIQRWRNKKILPQLGTTVTKPSGLIGKVLGVDDDGLLRLRLPDGSIQSFSSASYTSQY